ncbi:MAG: bifunctional ADP-dependent NAD(P)H-hydrate dehydratase/NAD(P)H-hydrate epimerase [Piscirickettsiaceae bacterium CG12_big_fil_rev_8_21_14_0_65_44_934]|nr:MAG: bifunctional ADP-dependent NAD(P)H-hydrate dehydratase/NAD(P)H-hydrate epimerase [Piscirickettsiaceae bacterium CG12_big_fil_rev_8_21_14_0_65_44_934]
MMKLYNARQSKQLDQCAQRQLPGLLLMKRAALFAYKTLNHIAPKAKKLLVLAGTGNNGGDGLMLAQYALIEGYEVDVTILGNPDQIQGDAQTVWQECQALGLTANPLTINTLTQADILVDAVLGIGLNKPVTRELAQQFQLINSVQKPVLALDIPSGLSADTGAVLGSAIQASHTCTFITHKPGLYTAQGTDTVGHPLKAAAHKGSQGTLLLIGGNRNMMGAIQLAGMAALNSGAGLVKILTKLEHCLAITQAQPELMVYDADAPHQLASLLESIKAIAIGPGLGQDDWAQYLWQQIMPVNIAKVVDADALNLLAKSPQKRNDWVLTPHPGEAARLLNTTTQTIQRDRFEAIRQLQQKYGGVIVLKGNGTLIYDGQQMELCTAGNAGMAVGGMGDVLTGTLASFIGQGLSLFDAACLGVYCHAHSGDLLANQKSQAGILPTDVIATLSQLLKYGD